ncbi:MAG: hypothetical protein LBE34_04240 [Flavobacteriaceae bacterium]|jgi:hypothetical protein|nr:hypothetical protein [Flavobacteriaceae bacterium]
MKKKIIPLVVLLGTMGAYAQTGIGTSLPQESAELEVSSGNKGVLIPRLALKSETDKTTIVNGSQIESLLVYHTGIPDLEAGFYFWANSKWNALVSNSTLYKYIKETAKDGNVTITNEGDNNFTFTWIDKSTNKQKTTTINELIKSLETITSLSAGTDPLKATLVYTREGKDDTTQTIELTPLLKRSEDFKDFLKDYITTGIKETITKIVADKNTNGKNNGVYNYYNEELEKEGYMPFKIDIINDVENNFQNIIDNADVKTILNNYFKTKVIGNVTYEGGNFYVTIEDGNGGVKNEVIDITQIIKDNSFLAKLTLTPAADNVDNVKAGFTFNDGKNVDNKKFAETLTTMTKEAYTMYVYYDTDTVTGEQKEVHVDVKRDEAMFGEPINTYQAYKFTYLNEKGDTVVIKGSDLLGATDNGNGGNFLETLTTFRYDPNYPGGPALVYTDEKKAESFVLISQLFQKSETITTLSLDEAKRELHYKNETPAPPVIITLDNLVQEPWYVEKTIKQATKNDDNIYTKGWVGIGFDEKSAAPNEMLRVNGSITATNSYYADYVFESYFNGSSKLKYNYKFNDLNTVSEFINTNRHLPGITPISDLEKTTSGYSFNVSELSIQLLEKTEELFLHVIEQQKELNAKETRIEKLESEVSDMAKRLQALEALLTK